MTVIYTYPYNSLTIIYWSHRTKKIFKEVKQKQKLFRKRQDSNCSNEHDQYRCTGFGNTYKYILERTSLLPVKCIRIAKYSDFNNFYITSYTTVYSYIFYSIHLFYCCALPTLNNNYQIYT